MIAPPKAAMFARSALQCWLCFVLFVCFLLAFSAECHAMLTYNRQALLDIAKSHSHFEITGFIPLELQLIFHTRRRHHPHSQEGPKHRSRGSKLTPGERFGEGVTSEARGEGSMLGKKLVLADHRYPASC